MPSYAVRYYFFEGLAYAIGGTVLLLPWVLWCVMPLTDAFAVCGVLAYAAVLFVAVTDRRDRKHSYPGQGY